jgi:uncharacterized protein (UPF0548 family)
MTSGRRHALTRAVRGVFASCGTQANCAGLATVALDFEPRTDTAQGVRFVADFDRTHPLAEFGDAIREGVLLALDESAGPEATPMTVVIRKVAVHAIDGNAQAFRQAARLATRRALSWSTLTYPHVGATHTDRLPAGFRHVRRHVKVGEGFDAFLALRDGMRRWGIHTHAGLALRAEGPVAENQEFASGLGIGPARLWAPCRIVWIDSQPRQYGYGFGTRPGHPETGEESMIVTVDDDQQVWFTIRAFSRPLAWYARLGGPLTALVQDIATARYVASAQLFASRTDTHDVPRAEEH